MFTLGAVSFGVFILRFVVFTFEESPKYLLSKGKDEEALKVLRKVAKTNKMECHVTMESFKALEVEDEERSSSESSADGTGAGRGMLGNSRTVIKKERPFHEAPMERVKVEFKRVGILFSTPLLARLTILVWVTYAFDYWGFSVAGMFPFSLV